MPPAPRRPLTSRGAATRDRIVDAAADLIYTDGVAETSLDAVMAATRTSKSQLYHYFADKDDLVLAVIQRQTERVLAAQPSRLDSPEALRTWRDAVVEMQRRRHCAGGCPIGSLVAELAAGPRAQPLLAEGFDRWAAHLRLGIEAMAARSELRPGADPADLALGLLAALQGGLLLSQATRSTRALELALDMALDQVTAQLR